MSGDKFVTAVALPVKSRPRVEQRKVVKDSEEVLEVVNSYLSIPVTSFSARRMEQVEYLSHISTEMPYPRLTLIKMRVQEVTLT